jgi:4-hydroxybenzoate polyprenyltransferase
MASLLVGGYFVLSSIYTLYLKTKLGIDVVLLSVFHTGRIVLGGVAMDIEISKWTLIFSIFFFTTIALTKRISELVRHIEGQPGRSRRGYFKADLEILGAHAAGSGLVASLTVVLYISSTEAALLYRRPEWLWFICFLQMYWTFRLLILSRRGHLSEDPTLFAWKDRATWTCWFAVLLIGWLAK